MQQFGPPINVGATVLMLKMTDDYIDVANIDFEKGTDEESIEEVQCGRGITHPDPFYWLKVDNNSAID